MLVRGMHYLGWQPTRQPVKRGWKLEEFLALIAHAYRDHPEVSPEGLVWAVFKIMERRVRPGEIKDV
jgi:uncharacterized protein (DUF2267 family)